VEKSISTRNRSRGRNVSRLFDQEGALVTIADINEEKLNEVGQNTMPKF
jgi:hypothetical protein